MADIHEPRRLLVVHGYEMYLDDGCLILSRAASEICEYIITNNILYKNVLLLGGWDSPKLPPDKTIGVMMKQYLIERGVSAEKILLPGEYTLLQKYMPPRDSAEEAELFKQFSIQYIRGLENVRVLVASPWYGRVKCIYKRIHMNPLILTVDVPVSFIFSIKLLIAQILAFFDPIGKKERGFFGRPFRKNRLARSFLQPRSSGLQPLQEWLIP